ncbi:TraX family protein [Enterocloster lavalensis]|uniref:TraX family protein n=1 Tax=Enterocloster lavalensis TaxID=460384 RepID=UPI001D087A05|nr:TraX family protein [Enterocloster lavalensis]MCB6341423.1 conjugal transfer protein TraX [Enterocloster lavalensis]
MNGRVRRRRYSRRAFNGLTGNQLKLIGMLAMFADHIGAVVIQCGILHGRDALACSAIIATASGQRWLLVGKVCRYAGRLAFPIFAFLLVEGFRHSRNRAFYALRIGVLALVSEIPFDLAVYNTWFYPGYQNVLFTLLIGIVVMEGLELLDNLFLQIVVIAGGCGLAWVIKSDYSVLGVLLIAGLYWFRHNDVGQLVCGVALSAAESLNYYCVSALAYVPIVLYNGRRGAQEFKYLFYVIYPVHLLALHLFAGWITGRVGV